VTLLIAVVCTAAVGCGGAKIGQKKDDFFTSGSREADQRASQRMAKAEQLAGSGEGSGEKGVKKAVAAKPPSHAPNGDAAVRERGGAPERTVEASGETKTNKAAQVEGKLALFDRLGGEKGLNAIVDDFLPRVLQDPRVNWPRNGVKRGGFSFKRGESVSWKATESNMAALKKHFVQFLSLATGGPAHYEGKEIKPTHAAMHIANPEFDAALGDLKASLDKLQIPNKEQKELLSIIESTRPQIVTQR
jgi:hemoglobin